MRIFGNSFVDLAAAGILPRPPVKSYDLLDQNPSVKHGNMTTSGFDRAFALKFVKSIGHRRALCTQHDCQ